MKEGDYVLAGQNITRGPLDPKDILRLNGVEGVYQYLLKDCLLYTSKLAKKNLVYPRQQAL